MATMASTVPAGNELPAVRAERDRFVALAFCWADVLFEVDALGRVVFAGGATLPLTGETPESLVERSLIDIVDPRDRPLAKELLALADRRGRIENTRVRLKGIHGPTQPLSLAGYRLDDLDGHYFLAFRVAGGKRRGAGGPDLPRDPESGLYAGDSFNRVVGDQLAAAGTEGRLTLIELEEISPLYERLDDVSRAQLQQTIGSCLRSHAVNDNAAARLGIGRYGVIHRAGVGIGELRDKIALYARNADPAGKGVTVESATLDIDRTSVTEEDLANGLVYAINQFRNARDGRFTIRNLSTNLSALVDEAAHSVNDFKHLVEDSRFDIAFQPIVHAVTGQVHHFEALARFPEASIVKSPYEYITFAEETGLIAEFDLAMARKAVEWMSQKANKGYSVAVNVSGRSVESLDYVGGIHALLRANSWAHRRLVFEITESSRMQDLSVARNFIEGLRKEGYHVCLDDFGAGAANFQYLSTLEVDTVKLDGSAIQNAQNAQKGKAFLKALTSLCRELGVKTIAEMIADRKGLEFVRECRVDFVQGYLFGKPSSDIRSFEKSFPKPLFTALKK